MLDDCSVRAPQLRFRYIKRDRRKKSMRRFYVAGLICLMASLFVLPLLASSEAVAAKTFTIKVWTYDTWLGITGKETEGMALDDPRRAKYTELDWWKWVGEKFQKEHPNVKIDFQFEKLFWSEGLQKVDVAIAAGEPPDILVENTITHKKYARLGLMEPIDDYLTKQDKEDFGWWLELGKLGDHYYSFPLIGGNRYMVANYRIFKERGVTDLLPGGENNPDRLWTFEQFLKAAMKTTYDKNGDGQADVFGWGMTGWGFGFDKFPFFWGYGATLFDKSGEKFTLNSPEGVKGLQFQADLLLKYKVVPPGIGGLPDNVVGDMWNEGKIAMFLGSHGTKWAFERALKDGTIKPNVIELYPMMFPSELPKHQPQVFITTDCPGVFRQKDVEKRKLVMEFARYITNPEHNKMANLASMSIPTRKSIGDIYKGDPFQQYVYRASKYGSTDIGQPYRGDVARQFLQPMWQAVFSGVKTPAQALKEAEERATKWLAEQLRREEELKRKSSK